MHTRYISNKDNRQITYNTFLKYCPKNFKKGEKRTDIYGICKIGKKVIKYKFKNI